VKTNRLILAAGIAALACGMIGSASAQPKQGYWTQGADAIWKTSAGRCWKPGYWTPAMAIAECDPDLVPKPAPKPVAAPPPPPPPPALKPAPAAKPAPKPTAKPKPVVLRSTVIFPTGGAKLDEMAKFRLDTDIVGKLGAVGAIGYVNVNGHADRLGSAQFNQKLSERRADAVKAYLVSKGMDASKIEVYGYGKTLPVKSCPDGKNRKALVACLEPNRRVEVELQGRPK
jgi:OOP family OmpA-OmpF porin